MRRRKPPRSARLRRVGPPHHRVQPAPRRARRHTMPLDDLRLRAGLSVRALARKAGLDHATVSRVLRGVQRGTAHTITRLHAVLAAKLAST